MKDFVTVLIAAMVSCAFAQAAPAAEAVKFTDGTGPDGVIDVNGTLYGTTAGGGSFGCEQPGGCGTVFSLDPITGVEKVLYSFCSQLKCTDGYDPPAGLIDVKGTLYGTTAFGPPNNCDEFGCGTVFSFDPQTGVETVLHSFGGGTDGFDPEAGLIDVKDTLYGTTDIGGAYGFGTAFALDRKTAAETVLYSFCQDGPKCADGQNPAGAGLIDVKGTLYGTTASGGGYGCSGGQGCGEVFSLDPNTGAEMVVHSFGSGNDGRYPEAGLIAVKGVLYGTTSAGGVTGCFADFGCGTVFSLDLKTGTETVLYSFCSQQNCTDGAVPSASLIDVVGVLYGTTYGGGIAGCGSYGCGTVFSLDLSTGSEKVLYSFCSQPNCADGASPSGSLIQVGDTLYGTTGGGGVTGCGGYGCGTVFSLDPVTGAEKVIYAFCSKDTCT